MERYNTPTVLIVEDEPDMASMLKMLLERKFSATVEIAEDRASAREKLEFGTFDVITLDYQLPDGDGLEFLGEINKRDNPPPVIMVTGHGDERTAVESFKHGASGYVVKDKRLSTLFPEAVEHALSGIRLKRAEETLWESERMYRALLDASPDTVGVFDLEGNFIATSELTLEALGESSVNGVLGKSGFDYFHPEDTEKAASVFAELLKNGHVANEEFRMLQVDGSYRPMEASGALIYDQEDNPKMVMVVMRDITERKRAEEEVERTNAELEGYAHSVSHDLKGPMSGIMLGVEMLGDSLESIDTGDAGEMSEIVAAIDRNARNAQRRINDLLFLAEVGQEPRGVSYVDVREIIDGVLEERSHVIKEKGIEVNLSPDLGTVTASPTQIQQVFSNLIGNAIRHNDSESLVIGISYLGDGEDCGHHYLVRDNGPGIPEDLIDDIFLPFTKGKGGGNGVGLSIAQKLVKVYGGQIKAYNDSGACFEFTLRNF